ncbi:MAG: hypothetical protein K0R40_3448 [Burkholderiales bacterium]|jgi:hypothetical protein|nr:hypothetical protein [Burkholderiales bacterium]
MTEKPEPRFSATQVAIAGLGAALVVVIVLIIASLLLH